MVRDLEEAWEQAVRDEIDAMIEEGILIEAEDGGLYLAGQETGQMKFGGLQ